MINDWLEPSTFLPSFLSRFVKISPAIHRGVETHADAHAEDPLAIGNGRVTATLKKNKGDDIDTCQAI